MILPKTYVKVFVKSNAGNVEFYKDGYTDLRGKFDYSTKSKGDVRSIDRFSILIVSESLGSVIKEAGPPSLSGKIKNQ